MACKAVLLALVLVCLVQEGVGIVYPTITFDGWDVIFLDQPSYLFSLQQSYSEEQMYVFGQDTLRVVTTGSNFTVQDHATAIEWHQQFISLHVFHNGTDLWAIGPTNPSDYSAHPDGYDLPIALCGPLWQTQKVNGLQGFILFSVYVDGRNLSDTLSYMVGWVPVQGQGNETVNQVALGVVRLHMNLTEAFAQRQFTFNYSVDVVNLYMNSFSIYNPHHKPQLHYENDTNILIVVDPATSNIFTVQVGPGTTPMVAKQSQNVHTSGMAITSSLFHDATNLLYLGFASEGTGNGSVVAYSMSSIVPQHAISFFGMLANPRAIAIDEPTDTIYVGFNGGDQVIQLDYLLNIQGYQRVPVYLERIEAAQVGVDHVYFITNEQYSKVIRVSKANFCTMKCPYWGYCQDGQCVCDPAFVMSANKSLCLLPPSTNTTTTITITIYEKDAAVALGVLFALSFVAALVGWIMFLRARKGGYQQV